MRNKQRDILTTKTGSLSFSSFLLSAEKKKNPYEKKKADIFIDGFSMASTERERQREKEKKKIVMKGQSHA